MAKTIMIAPAGCSGATIDGHEIEPDAAGEVHISSPLMIETLKKHGFIVKGMAPAPNRIPVAVPDPNATFQPLLHSL